ncbi:MAG TPA: DHA2 family efflux MFS transporter permease subunit [Actinophytocola sp.]|jgi:EmrB/QacA subfamily drug resistance transporter|uniref:DHA2 family efflux MFS transporter permease subunit n=1 Tax=Actinophytocola sp. TaxID=1872138 RepID=UPI002F949EC8
MTDSRQDEAVATPRAEQTFVWTRRHTLMLAVVAAAHILDTIDIAIVNVALPQMKASLGFSEAGLSWVVNGYLVAFGGFLLLCGRAGDILGKRRVLLIGLALFTVASLAAGLATDATTLVVMRGVQGAGAALISPMTLALLATIFPDGPRAKAIAIWGMISGVSGVVGLILGGLLTTGPGWRWIFLINVPVTIAVIVGAVVWLERDPANTRRRPFDLLGAIIATAGMTLVVLGIVQASQAGWGAASTIVPLVIGVVLLGYLVLHEGRVAKDPLLPLSLFKIPTVTGANATQALVGSGMFVLFYIATLYQQEVLHYNSLQTGLAYVPLSLVLMGFAKLTPKLVGTYGVRAVVLVGAIIAAVGMGLLAFAGTDGSFLVNILGPTIVIGVGMALTFLPLSLAAVTGVPADGRGVASGLINVSRITGGALGLSIVAAFAAGYTKQKLESGTSAAIALTDGFRIAFIVGAVLLALAAFTALLLPRKPAGAAAKG